MSLIKRATQSNAALVCLAFVVFVVQAVAVGRVTVAGGAVVAAVGLLVTLYALWRVMTNHQRQLQDILSNLAHPVITPGSQPEDVVQQTLAPLAQARVSAISTLIGVFVIAGLGVGGATLPMLLIS